MTRASALALLVLLAAGLAIGEPEDDTTLRILSPLEGSTVTSPVDCVVRTAVDTAPVARVDGVEQEWLLSAGRARRASLELAPGEHEVTIDETTVRFTVTEDAKAADLGRAHVRDGEGLEACKPCHEATEGDNPELGAVRQPGGCLECHSRTDFDLAHFHPMEPIRNCGECHALHGSARPSLLRAPAKELCARCHD
jgi:predicted CXXCH cytochrome family protein